MRTKYVSYIAAALIALYSFNAIAEGGKMPSPDKAAAEAKKKEAEKSKGEKK